MKFHRQSLAVFVLGAAFSVGALAQASEGRPDDAKKLAAAAAQHVKKVGIEQASKDFSSDKQWTVKDLTVWAMDTKGVMRYHTNPKMIGKELLEVKDQNGRPFNKEMVAIGKGTQPGKVDYEWAHPETKKLSPKTAFLNPVAGSDLFVGVSVTH